MYGTVLDSRRYTLDDQLAFARLSGDWNPLHIDPVRARRFLFGDVVVHGIHIVARALEAYAASQPRRPNLRLVRLGATFTSPVYLGRDVSTVVVDQTDRRAHIQARSGPQVLAEIHAEWTSDGVAAGGLQSSQLLMPADEAAKPFELSFDQLHQRQGELPLLLDREACRARFPAILEELGDTGLATILALTRLVGMDCPGLHSVFASFEVEFPTNPIPILHYNVARTDARFSRVKMTIGGSAAGSVLTYFRPPPMTQPAIRVVREHLTPNEFRGRTALVVGGSRGLGEVAAKVIGAGGGRVVVTYHRGQDDAERVAGEIREHGGDAQAIEWDVATTDGASLLRDLGIAPDMLLYFASPKIFVKRSEEYDPALFADFTSVYVDGFFRAWSACRAICRERVGVLYPSSTAIDEKVRDLLEYAAAKSAGETLCDFLRAVEPRLPVLVTRLPRTATDQTATMLPVAAADPLTLLLPLLRHVRDL